MCKIIFYFRLFLIFKWSLNGRFDWPQYCFDDDTQEQATNHS